MIRRFGLIELLVLWLEPGKTDDGRWLPVFSLMALTFAIEGLLALWIMGAFRPL